MIHKTAYYMNKKTYSAPQTTFFAIEATSMIAASRFNRNTGDQTITVTNDEYDGEFATREYEWPTTSNIWEE